MLRKIHNNFGRGALHALGFFGYLKYLASASVHLWQIGSSRDLRPIDKSMSGILRIRHPVSGKWQTIDLGAYRAGDVDEGTFAFGSVREIWFRNVYFRQFDLRGKLAGVVDLGANRGLFTLLAAALADRVIAVEVLEKYRSPMQHNLGSNGLDNVTIINAFVGGAGLFEPIESTVDLTEIIELLEGRAVDFVKIDIEGSEFGLDIGQFHEVKRVAMEIHKEWGDSGHLVEAVEEAGFDCRTYDDALRPCAKGAAVFLLAVNKRFADARWLA